MTERYTAIERFNLAAHNRAVLKAWLRAGGVLVYMALAGLVIWALAVGLFAAFPDTTMVRR